MNAYKKNLPNTQFTTKYQPHGFTLIEIIVVMVILSVLGTLIATQTLSRPDEARATAAQQNIQTLKQALKLYRLDNGRYPTSEQNLNALTQKPVQAPIPNNWKTGGYIDKLPNDPWGRPYQYRSPGTHGDEIEIVSWGADGKPGGEGLDADIGSWQI